MAKRLKLSRADLKKIRNRIDIARKYAEQTWLQRDTLHAALYRGNFDQILEGVLPTDRAVFNYLGRLVKLKTAALAAEPPLLRFKPRGDTSQFPLALREALARVWEVYIPYLWREAEIHRQNKAVLRDKGILGRGWAWIDWRFETQEFVIQGERPEDAEAQENILFDNPWVQRVSPRFVGLDPDIDTYTWEQAAYISWDMRWPIERIKNWAMKDKRVNQAVAERIKGDESINKLYIPDGTNQFNQDLRRAAITRYHQREDNLVVYVAKEIEDEPLMVMENRYEFEGYPCEPLWGEPILDKLDAVGDVEAMRSWQRMKTLIDSKMATMVRRARRFTAIPSNTDEDDVQAIEEDQDKVIVRFDPGASQPPREVGSTGIPPEVLQFLNAIMRDYTELSGVNELRRGLTPEGLGTATETAQLVTQSSVGERDDQAEWEDFNRRVARKVKALVEQFGDAERIALVSPDVARGLESVPDPTGGLLVDVQRTQQFVWVRFSPQRIRDEAEVEVVAGSMGAREEALDRAQFTKAVEVTTQIAQSAPQLQAMGLNPQEIAKEMWRKHGNTETSQFFQTPQPATAPAAPANGGGAGNTPVNTAQVIQSVLGAAQPPGQGGV